MSKSIRIRTTPLGDDKYLKVKIDQDFDFLEILSLKISQTDAYKKYCSDYGVVVGRVVVNNGFGIPNAKVSIFIPLSEEDKTNTLIAGLYPYESVYSKDSKGVRYNLLSNQPRPDDECHVAVGTFPTKREVLDCDTTLEIFEKYYKYTTTTNDAGDFMLFGVPVGEHTIHVDVDLSDIGFVSQKPYELISQGYNKNLFASPTQYKTSSNLDILTQIKSRNSSVSVIPFWGNLDDCDEIGITRIDFDLNYNIIPTAIFIGSIFGDNEKSSVNKRCNPRRKMGLLCNTVTGEGTIEIIRKTQDNLIESFSIDGDRLINENGVWCFQIPMNLDKVVTDEFGNLIPSEDPDKGIPTNAKVRFRVGIDETGEEGRLRSRAKFLIPNRTNDYNFDDSTSDDEFADLRWKKVYTVRQFIARYQKYCGTSICGTRRGFIGIKDVDDCGDHTPFPYNRIDTDLNPLFSIICLIVTILMTLIELINLIIISLINIIIGILNFILCIICTIIFAIAQFINSIVSAVNKIPGISISFDPCSWCIGTGCCNCGNIMNYLPCISINCDEKSYAPGCYKPSTCNYDKTTCNIPTDVQSLGWCGAANGQLDYYPGDGVCNQLGCGTYSPGDCHGCCGPVPLGFIPFAGAMDCIQIQLARALNVYKFDFYNDWINGSLYAFLYKYKVKRKKNKKRTLEKFCDYDCHDDFETDAQQPEHKRNKCRNSLHLVDTCTSGNNVPTISFISTSIKEGVIKEYKDNLYYAAYTHDKSNILYATDVTCLGSAVNCDIDGQQKIFQQLIPTSYKIPPDTAELDDNNNLETTAIDPLLLEVNCFRIKISQQNCNNIKRICEIGIGLDEDRTDDLPNAGDPANCIIDIFDTKEELESELLRNELGKCATGIFNYNSSVLANYNKFRGFNDPLKPNPLNLPTRNSYFYYFGINPGRGAIECANANYFVPCKIDKKNLIPALITSVDNVCANQNLGSINVNLLGGQQPFTYSLVDAFSNIIPGGSPASPVNGNLISFSNLFAGSYQLSVTDNNGDNSLYNINVNGPLSLNATVNNISGATSPTSTNGAIDITAYGGVSPYTYLWSPGGYTTQDITNVPVGTYSVTITDSGPSAGCPVQVKTITGLTISSPPPLGFSYSTLTYNGGYRVKCYGASNGQIVLSNITGGTGPYTIYVNGVLKTSTTISNLSAGTYTIKVYDATSAQSQTQIVVLNQPPQLTASHSPSPSTVLCFGCTVNITASGAGGVPPYTYQWNYNNITTPTITVPTGTYKYTVTDANGCQATGTTIVTSPPVLSISNITPTNPNCYGGPGSVSFTIGGGSPNYTYRIYSNGGSTTYTPNCNPCSSPACTTSCISNPGPQIGTTVTNTPAGVKTVTIPSVVLNKQYFIEVTDIFGCKTCDTFTLTSPTLVTGLYSYNVTNPSSTPKLYSINVSANGGTPNYTIGLKRTTLPAAAPTCSSPNIATAVGSTTTFTNQPGGTNNRYRIVITDSKGCQWCSPVFQLPA